MKEDHTTPPESISYNNLVELAVKQRHGSDAIAELTNHEDGKVERAGKRIDYLEDCKRWDSAKDAIIQACYAGELVAYVCNESGTVKKIDRQYWDEDSSAVVEKEKQYWEKEGKQVPSFVEHQKTPRWYALSTGTYQSPKLPTFYNQTVYFKEEEAMSFLDTLSGGTTKKAKAKAHPDTDRARMDHFREEIFIPTATKLFKNDAVSTYPELMKHKKIEGILDTCGFPEGEPSDVTLEKWARSARKLAGKPGNPGRPKKSST